VHGLVVGYEVPQAGKLYATILDSAVSSACRTLVGDPRLRDSCSDDRGVANTETSEQKLVDCSPCNILPIHSLALIP